MTTASKRNTTSKAPRATTTSGTSKGKPRQTKRAQLIGLLKAGEGADIGTLSRKLGWQTHTTRAALTGLRKAGFSIERTAPEGGGAASYRITAEPQEPAAQ